ncbi:hypothetical protein IFM89_014973 [Coptis chinensis]|uniref:Uncharacterized protein n=1 Tax=Coptis chinensis TaxID=261450 RepID=A0A835HPZ8_9MAGN|nr:hypothetical protein IFM89_014973 [Coptis chinensis]
MIPRIMRNTCGSRGSKRSRSFSHLYEPLQLSSDSNAGRAIKPGPIDRGAPESTRLISSYILLANGLFGY